MLDHLGRFNQRRPQRIPLSPQGREFGAEAIDLLARRRVVILRRA